LVEYKIEEIKMFLEKTGSVYDGLKSMLNNYMVTQNLKRIDFDKETL
jgi:hypothetical protein